MVKRRISVFSENITQSKNGHRVNIGLRGWGGRLTIYYVILVASFFIMSGRIAHLSIVQGAQNYKLSNDNRIKSLIIHAPRGNFVDRKGDPLVENIPAYRVSLPCEEGKSCKTQLLTAKDLEKNKITPQSVYVEADSIRKYLHPHEFAHVLGYMSEITAEEVGNPYYVYQGYGRADRLGRSGLEAVFEKKLHGTDGKELIEVDAQSVKVRTLGTVDPIPGENIQLALDKNLQLVAYQALGENPGAVVVTRVSTGELLALVSSPAFDPNVIHSGLDTKEFERLVYGQEGFMFNRAVSGVYPPGSTFKLISAVAALESKKMTADTIIEDTGHISIGDFSFNNWFFTQYGKTDGNVNMVKALARSNDVYFYRLGEEVGVDEIAVWGRKFGIGSTPGTQLFGEAAGVMPDKAWRKKVQGTEWYLGDTYHIAIGQGDLQTSPVQVNNWTQTVANKGVKCTPTLLKIGEGGEQRCESLKISEQTIKTITEGMQHACEPEEKNGYAGTGYPLFNFSVVKESFQGDFGTGEKKSVPVACKTGTAEFGDPQNRTHAWFTAFAPLPGEVKSDVISGDPEIAVTVLVERGGEGSTVAAPIAKKVLEEWFRR